MTVSKRSSTRANAPGTYAVTFHMKHPQLGGLMEWKAWCDCGRRVRHWDDLNDASLGCGPPDAGGTSEVHEATFLCDYSARAGQSVRPQAVARTADRPVTGGIDIGFRVPLRAGRDLP